jgi:hypothetical protein
MPEQQSSHYNQIPASPRVNDEVLVKRSSGEIVTMRVTGNQDERGRLWVESLEDEEIDGAVGRAAKPVSLNLLSPESQAALAQELQEQLDVTRPRAEIEQMSQQAAEDVGKAALDGAGILAPNVPSVSHEMPAGKHESILSSSELSQLGGFLGEMARQSALYRQQGDRYIAQNDSNIAEQAHQHLDRITNGLESAEAGLVAISSILGGISNEAERLAVFDMLKRSGALNEDDMRRVGNELWNLDQLEAVPGVEADYRKVAYAENLSRQANAELEAHEGAANNKYLALMSIVHGVGSRIHDRSYSNRVMDGAFGKIVDSKR